MVFSETNFNLYPWETKVILQLLSNISVYMSAVPTKSKACKWTGSYKGPFYCTWGQSTLYTSVIHTNSYKHVFSMFKCFLCNIHTPVDALESNLVSILPKGIWHVDYSSQGWNHQSSDLLTATPSTTGWCGYILGFTGMAIKRSCGSERKAERLGIHTEFWHAYFLWFNDLLPQK